MLGRHEIVKKNKTLWSLSLPKKQEFWVMIGPFLVLLSVNLYVMIGTEFFSYFKLYHNYMGPEAGTMSAAVSLLLSISAMIYALIFWRVRLILLRKAHAGEYKSKMMWMDTIFEQSESVSGSSSSLKRYVSTFLLQFQVGIF